MTYRNTRHFVLLAATTFIAGCQTVSSRQVGPGVMFDTKGRPPCSLVDVGETCAADGRQDQAADGNQSAGITYFLPRQLARVTATRTDLTLEKDIAAVIKAQGELEAARAAVAAATSAISQTENSIISGEGGAPAQPILAARLAAQRAALVTATADVPLKQAALDQAKAKLTASAATTPPAAGALPRFKVTLKIELLPPSADPANAYRLSPRHMPFRDDEHNVVVSSAGLLTSTNTVAVDRTADILVEIGTFAGAIKSGIPVPGGVGRDGRPAPAIAPDRCTLSPNEFVGVVDFADPLAVNVLNADLQCLGVRTQVTGQIWPDSTRPAPRPSGNVDGIVYRNPVEVEVRIEKCIQTDGGCAADSPYWVATEVVAIALPQAGPISYVRQEAGFMTRSRYALAFKDGILTSYDASRPNEFLQIAGTPMRIVDGVLSGIGRGIHGESAQNNALAALSASQLAMLNSNFALQAGRINGQTTITNAEVAALNAEFAQRTAQIAGETGLTNAQITALNAEFAMRLAQINAQASIANAQLAAFNAQSTLQTGQITAQTSLNNSQLTFLQSQTGLAAGGNSAAGQLLASDFALTIAQLRDQSRREALSRCIAQQQTLNAPIDSCLVGL